MVMETQIIKETKSKYCPPLPTLYNPDVFIRLCYHRFLRSPTLVSCKLIRNGIQDQSMVLATCPIEAGVEFAKLCSCSSTGALFFHIWRLVGG